MPKGTVHDLTIHASADDYRSAIRDISQRVAELEKTDDLPPVIGEINTPEPEPLTDRARGLDHARAMAQAVFFRNTDFTLSSQAAFEQALSAALDAYQTTLERQGWKHEVS